MTDQPKDPQPVIHADVYFHAENMRPAFEAAYRRVFHSRPGAILPTAEEVETEMRKDDAAISIRVTERPGQVDRWDVT